MNGNVVDAISGIRWFVFQLTPVCLFYCYCRYRAKLYLKGAEDPQNPAESSGSPPDKQPMQDEIGYVVNMMFVCLFLSFFWFIVLGQS